MSLKAWYRGMSGLAGHGGVGRRLMRLALTAAFAALAAPGAALAAAPHERVTGSVRAWDPRLHAPPDQVIDAQTAPQAAANALNTGCANLSNCAWQADSPVTIAYGPAHILGDALYNCSAPNMGDAYIAVGISETLGESTSLSERVTVAVGLGFLGFEKATAEFSAFSSQSESFSTTVETTYAVEVPSGYKGWTETRVLTASVTGSAYITDGIHLIQVKDIDLSFPGYRNPNDNTDTPVASVGYKTPMNQNDINTRCNAVNGLGAPRLGAPTPLRRVTQLAAPKGSFSLTLCQAGGGCATRTVTGTRPPHIGQATATLTRHGHTYATGTDIHGRIRLTTLRRLSAGRYTLTMRERPIRGRNNGRRTLTTFNTIVPIAIP
ncbi:MAG: hypothetical protein JO168_25345 [Solirubrobacterales bacterium]|nr:hypothetical protein [Solirubrobacterales bacterium]